jgi:hypothetical protein
MLAYCGPDADPTYGGERYGWRRLIRNCTRARCRQAWCRRRADPAPFVLALGLAADTLKPKSNPHQSLLWAWPAPLNRPNQCHALRGHNYPARPVRIIVGAPAGSAPDIVARLMEQWFSERLRRAP